MKFTAKKIRKLLPDNVEVYPRDNGVLIVKNIDNGISDPILGHIIHAALKLKLHHTQVVDADIYHHENSDYYPFDENYTGISVMFLYDRPNH